MEIGHTFLSFLNPSIGSAKYTFLSTKRGKFIPVIKKKMSASVLTFIFRQASPARPYNIAWTTRKDSVAGQPKTCQMLRGDQEDARPGREHVGPAFPRQLSLDRHTVGHSRVQFCSTGLFSRYSAVLYPVLRPARAFRQRPLCPATAY